MIADKAAFGRRGALDDFYNTKYKIINKRQLAWEMRDTRIALRTGKPLVSLMKRSPEIPSHDRNRPPLPANSWADQHALPVLAAMAKPTIDHRGPEFGKLGLDVLTAFVAFSVRRTGRDLPGFRHRSVGSGFGEHALPGDRVVMFETGWFATLWSRMAKRLASRRSSFPRIGARAPMLSPSRRG